MYTFDSRVRFSEVDDKEVISLPGIINYFQDCSTFHSEDVGLGIDRLKERNKVWILSSWQVVIDRYPKFGEQIGVSTWATGFDKLYGLRNFMMRDADGQPAAYANSIWVFMDIEKGRPARLSEEDAQKYGVEPALEMEYAPRKITLPKETSKLEPFVVRKYHIDTNKHVNNCQYVQMALEVLDEKIHVRQMRAEYKKSAVYKDVIVPRIAREEERTVIELCDTNEKPYAIVELMGEK